MNPLRVTFALALAALVTGACIAARQFLPAPAVGEVVTEGSFRPGGEFPGEPLTLTPTPRTWASWSGSDVNEGRVIIGPFLAPDRLRFALTGYPSHEGNALYLELLGLDMRVPLPVSDVGERWRVDEFDVPFGVRGRLVNLVAVDAAHGHGGWFGISEPLPLRTGRALEHGFAATFAAWLCNGLLLGIGYVVAASWLRRHGGLPAQWIPLAAGGIVALAGYGAFWAYFAHPLLGHWFSVGMLGLALHAWLRQSSATRHAHRGEVSTVLLLMLGIGAFYLALLHLYPASRDVYGLAADRFVSGLPGDNRLPHEVAIQLYHGQLTKELGAGWHSSDRPPLQAGWLLLAWPVMAALGFGATTASGTAAVWLQLLWVAAAYGMLRTVGLDARRSAAWTTLCACSGFFLQNTVFTWPKLAAAAFACGAFGLCVLPRAPSRREILAGATCAALAWLAHGGAAFSLLAAAPWLAWKLLRGPRGHWGLAAIVFAAITLPWTAYQNFHDPPGNRLVKWHLAGEGTIDHRSTWQAMRDGYGRLSVREIADHKLRNFATQVGGDWGTFLDFSPRTATSRRSDEFFHAARALTWWPVLALATVGIAYKRIRNGFHSALAGWIGVTLVLWCLLMFGGGQAVVHQGSYAMLLAAFVALSAAINSAGRWWLGVAALPIGISFAMTWIVPNDVVRGTPQALPIVTSIAAVVALAGIVWRTPAAENAAPSSREAPNDTGLPAGYAKRLAEPLIAWWRAPRLTIWVIAAIAVLLFLRKPHALHTPQLWAEDGSIFLTFNDLLGAHALLEPYMGYLRTIPRLVAWLASHTLDPAWWPAFYNGIAFAIWVAVIGRTFSPRLDLPAKPWLALAFVIGPQTGEVLFNITNAQWITAFVLVQQALITRPNNTTQRAFDLLILAVVSLTGPFALAFLPLFAWRAGRERNADTVAAVALVAACSAVQAWFILSASPVFDHQSQPLRLWPMLEIVTRRLVLWPVLGGIANELPSAVVSALGLGLLGIIFAWALRADERRLLRAQIAAALLLILAVGVYRTRPDTWPGDDLLFADRYFYIPRVLLAWLLALEFHAASRAVAWSARVLYAAIALTHVAGYMQPAPPDYHWAEYCDPIRRGVPANIPILPEGWTLEYRGRPSS